MGLFSIFGRLRSCVPKSPNPPINLENFLATANRMSEFDYAVGSMCAESYRDRGDLDKTLYYGMLQIFVAGLKKALQSPEDAERLLNSKIAQNEIGAEFVLSCQEEVSALIMPEIMQRFIDHSRRDDIPLVVVMATNIVNANMKRHKMPKRSLFKGYYSLMANFLYCYGLCLPTLDANLAEQLANDPY